MSETGCGQVVAERIIVARGSELVSRARRSRRAEGRAARGKGGKEL